MAEEPVMPVMISQLVSKFKELVKKVTYDKTEIDSKLNSKASNTLVSSSNNGLMSSVDKTKLDGVEEEANKTIVDSAMSSSSVNPVQNKIVHQELGNKSDINHTHDDRYYTESEMNTKLNAKANTTVASTSANGLMSSTMVTKLNSIATGANKTTVDTALSSSSTNPVQNKVVNAQLTSLNNNKANSNHTHNDYTATTTVPCNYGTVRKFRKNGWVMVIYENIGLTSCPIGSWVTLADIGWSNQAGNRYTGNFQTQDIAHNRFRVNEDGLLGVWRNEGAPNEGHYGYIVYPTAD